MVQLLFTLYSCSRSKQASWHLPMYDLAGVPFRSSQHCSTLCVDSRQAAAVSASSKESQACCVSSVCCQNKQQVHSFDKSSHTYFSSQHPYRRFSRLWSAARPMFKQHMLVIDAGLLTPIQWSCSCCSQISLWLHKLVQLSHCTVVLGVTPCLT